MPSISPIEKVASRLLWGLLFVCLVSCGQDETVDSGNLPVLRFAYSWAYGFNNTMKEYTERMKDRFLLETEYHIGLDHKQKILIDIASSDLPDVFFFWSYETNLEYLVRNDALLDVQNYFDLSSENDKNDFYREAMDSSLVRGKNYAIPHEQFFGFLAVNRELLARFDLSPPRTWEDIRRMTPILRENGVVPLSMGSFRGDPGHLFFSALAYQGEKGYEDTKAIKETNRFIYPGTELAARAVEDLVRWGAVPRDTIFSGSWDNQMKLYNREKAAMVFTFNWALALFDPEIAGRTVIIPVPVIPGGVRNPADFTVGGNAQSLCINKASWEDPVAREIIVQLADWLLSEEIFLLRLAQAGTFPAKKIPIPEYSNPIYRKVLDFVSPQTILGIHEFYFQSLDDFNDYKEANDLFWGGAYSAEDFLENVQDRLHE